MDKDYFTRCILDEELGRLLAKQSVTNEKVVCEYRRTVWKNSSRVCFDCSLQNTRADCIIETLPRCTIFAVEENTDVFSFPVETYLVAFLRSTKYGKMIHTKREFKFSSASNSVSRYHVSRCHFFVQRYRFVKFAGRITLSRDI